MAVLSVKELFFRREFFSSKCLGSFAANCSSNRSWAYIREGLFPVGYLHLRFWGLIFGRASFLGGGGGVVGA